MFVLLSVLLSSAIDIVLYVLLRSTASDYLIAIFKLFLNHPLLRHVEMHNDFPVYIWRLK